MLKSLHDYSKNELISIINDLRKRKKFGMVWEDKPEQAVEDCKSKLPVVREVESRSIELVEDAPTSLIIEGDNYHALKVLNYTHAGKIDVIYIDPPYNTGNQDFIYNDNYVDIDDDYRHSKWLCFMKRRLLLAKDLLAQDGVIFISIDDNEQARLKILCDQIFRERNFINCISVKSSETSGVKMSHIEKKLPKIKEYLLVYANNSESIKLNPITIPKSIDKKKFVAYSKYYSKIITNPDDVPEEWEIIPIKKYLKENGIVLDNEDELLNF
ncbi:MAG: site-specific DNA-methyltransferase, partial [Coriobacteriia bacterium]|nr:site-specific DNA-methyltransferase [Coriobacteriia bacterium]